MSTSTDPDTGLAVTVWPGLTPRLLRTEPGPEDLEQYRDAGGYRASDDPAALLDAVDRAGLVGRGGAAFPLATKLRTVRAAHLAGRDTVLVANGEEGEPASIKDRWLLRNRPHLVLDGLRLAARVIGAAHAHVYVSDAAAAAAVQHALHEPGTALDGVTVSVFKVTPATWPVRRPPRCARSTAARPNPPTNRRGRSKAVSAGYRP